MVIDGKVGAANRGETAELVRVVIVAQTFSGQNVFPAVVFVLPIRTNAMYPEQLTGEKILFEINAKCCQSVYCPCRVQTNTPCILRGDV